MILQPLHSATLDRTYTVVIDAGHGGYDNGSMGADGTKESDITLEIARVIRSINTNPNIHIVLTRNADIYVPIPDRIDFAKKQHADGGLSVHTNAADVTGTSGFEIYTPSMLKEGVKWSRQYPHHPHPRSRNHHHQRHSRYHCWADLSFGFESGEDRSPQFPAR